MNKTVVFVTFALLALGGLAGGTFILLVRPDASATFVNLLVIVLGLVTSAAGTFYALGKQGEKIDEIKTQTNGTLSKLRERNEELEQRNSELSRQLPPEA
jgi:hypothetical protein